MKTEASKAKAKTKQYIGFGLVTPWILEPNQSSRVGQNTSMIKGVPDPARYKNDADKTAKIEDSSATLFLNQRLRSNINNMPSTAPIMILGSLTE